MENKKIDTSRFSFQFPDYNLGVILDLILTDTFLDPEHNGYNLGIILDLILTDTFLDPEHNGYLSEGVVKLLNSYEILHEI